jgi:hypothetical protein
LKPIFISLSFLRTLITVRARPAAGDCWREIATLLLQLTIAIAFLLVLGLCLLQVATAASSSTFCAIN